LINLLHARLGWKGYSIPVHTAISLHYLTTWPQPNTASLMSRGNV